MEWLEKLINQEQERIYLDYASATPALSEVRAEMERYWSEEFYNPNAIYKEGEEVRLQITNYKAQIAQMFGAQKESVMFTSGGTEANTWVVRGVKNGKIIFDGDVHPSVIEAGAGMKGRSPTLVTSVTRDNKLGRKIREERKKRKSEYPYLHIDASQSTQYFNIGLETLACDIITLDSAKLYGPKGIGAIIFRKGVKLDLPPQGTPAVPLIAGFARALEIAIRDREAEFVRLSSLTDRFAKFVKKNLSKTDISLTLPNVVHLSVPGILPELLVLALDRRGVMVSAGPACNSNKPEPPETPVRFSFGKFTTEKEIEKSARIFCQVVQNLLK